MACYGMQWLCRGEGETRSEMRGIHVGPFISTLFATPLLFQIFTSKFVGYATEFVDTFPKSYTCGMSDLYH